METKTVAIYARVSTTHQEEEQTVKSQVMAVKEYAREHNMHIVQEYIDEGWSGDILARPALDDLRQDAEMNSWQGVLIYDPDRLARRYSYQELLIDELKEKGKEVLFVTVATPQNSEDKILQGVRGLFAEYERAKITERFRLGKLRKIKEGHILVSEANYGYIRVPKKGDKQGYYKINTHEADVVRRIFAWVGYEGLTIRKVIQRLEQLKIPPRKSVRGVWSSSTLTRLLRNPCYIGKAKWGSTKAVIPKKPHKQVKYKRQKKSSRIVIPKEEWLYVPVPAIVDKKLFDATQKQLKINGKLSNRNKKNDYLLSGILRCTCNRTRTGEGVQNGKHLYYRCTDRICSYPLPPKCKLKGINARELDRLAWEKISRLMTNPKLLKHHLKQYTDNAKTNEQYKIDKEDLKKQIVQFDLQKDRYYRAYGEGLIDIQKLKQHLNALNVKIEAITNELEFAEKEHEESSTVLPTYSELENFTEMVTKHMHDLSFKDKRRIILLVVEKVIASPLSAQVFGHIPIKNVELLTDDRYSQNANRHGIPIHFTIHLKTAQSF